MIISHSTSPVTSKVSESWDATIRLAPLLCTTKLGAEFPPAMAEHCSFRERLRDRRWLALCLPAALSDRRDRAAVNIPSIKPAFPEEHFFISDQELTGSDLRRWSILATSTCRARKAWAPSAIRLMTATLSITTVQIHR